MMRLIQHLRVRAIVLFRRSSDVLLVERHDEVHDGVCLGR
jgi:hypothetical protein